MTQHAPLSVVSTQQTQQQQTQQQPQHNQQLQPYDPQYQPPVQKTASFLEPTSLDEAWSVADALARSSFVPKVYQGQPANILVAMQMGAEVGLGPLQSVQSICVINGQPSLWGDAMLALVQGSVLCESFEEGFDVESQTGWARTRRRNREPVEQLFTIDMAQRAGLTGKPGPWKLYPERMCKLKARNWLCRDVYPDVLRGLSRLNVIERDLVDIGDSQQSRKQQQPQQQKQQPRPRYQQFQRPPTPQEQQKQSPPEHDRVVSGQVVTEPEDIDAFEAPDDDESPAVDEAYRLAVESIINALAEADSDAGLKAIKKDIMALPEAVAIAAGLVEMWNTRRTQIKQSKVS